jgi:hypothetical protein
MVKKYRKKPIVIEAIQYKGVNINECLKFLKEYRLEPSTQIEKDFLKETGSNMPVNVNIVIPTLEGDHLCKKYHYIIKGINGEFYPCKPDIFKKTYESIED